MASLAAARYVGAKCLNLDGLVWIRLMMPTSPCRRHCVAALSQSASVSWLVGSTPACSHRAASSLWLLLPRSLSLSLSPSRQGRVSVAAAWLKHLVSASYLWRRWWSNWLQWRWDVLSDKTNRAVVTLRVHTVGVNIRKLGLIPNILVSATQSQFREHKWKPRPQRPRMCMWILLCNKHTHTTNIFIQLIWHVCHRHVWKTGS